MLQITANDWVLWLHVVAACVWIGGQIIIAVVIPLLRRVDGLTVAVGRRYQAVAWPAFGVLVATGILNVHNLGLSWPALVATATGRTLLVKLGLVLVSGGAAGVHALVQAPRARSASARHPVASAVLGSISLLAAVAAALLGVAIAQG
jgi:putative copper export protein